MAAKELHDLLDRVKPADAQLVRALLERLPMPVDGEPITDGDIADVDYAGAHPEDRISHEEILREFGLAGAAPMVK